MKVIHLFCALIIGYAPICLSEYSKIGNDSTVAAIDAPAAKQPVQPSSEPSCDNAATIIVTSTIPDADVLLNGVLSGSTPYSQRGFLPGSYEVEVDKKGFKSFKRTIQCTINDTVRVAAELTSLFRLIVASKPSGATIQLNETSIGKTPFDSVGIKPGIYQLTIEHPEHVPWKDEISIGEKVIDTVNISLISTITGDSAMGVKMHYLRRTRQLIFGTLALGLTSAGVYFNTKAARQLEREKSAWTRYREKSLSGSEYSTRFETYSTIAEKTDRYMSNRDLYYLFGLIGAIGFALSIPF